MDLQQLKKQLSKDLNKASNSKDLQDLKIKYLGKKGKISLLSKDLGKLSQSERPQAGKAINLLKTFFEEQSQILSKEISKSKLLFLDFNNVLVKKYAMIAPINPKKYQPKKIATHLKYL